MHNHQHDDDHIPKRGPCVTTHTIAKAVRVSQKEDKSFVSSMKRV